MSLLELTAAGLYYKPADVYIDPNGAVPKALITHAHSDHARRGSSQYLCADTAVDLVKARVYSEQVSGIKFGETLRIGEATVSFHPAGHILGSAQIRLEHKGHVTVVSGDYKLEADPTCSAFEPVVCNHFVTESTFGLPVYNWEKSDYIFAEINQWWLKNRSEGKTSILFAYALGKAQRLLAGIDPATGPIGVHVLNRRFIPHYQRHIKLPNTIALNIENASLLRSKGLAICPSSLRGTKLLDALAPYSLATASGWMQTRDAIKKSGYDRGFALSDHADWPGLLEAISATKAEEVWTTHGFSNHLAKYLTEKGYKAKVLEQDRGDKDGNNAFEERS